jgi:hypothetical protein
MRHVMSGSQRQCAFGGPTAHHRISVDRITDMRPLVHRALQVAAVEHCIGTQPTCALQAAGPYRNGQSGITDAGLEAPLAPTLPLLHLQPRFRRFVCLSCKAGCHDKSHTDSTACL